MKTIIAATDFSPASANAAKYAADMALATGADLTLLNVYNFPVNYVSGVAVIPVDELRSGSEEGLEMLKKEIDSNASGALKITTVSRMGNITEELETYCNSRPPFALVIGTRGKTDFEKSVFGSSTLAIIKHLTSPVICIPPGVQYGKGIRQIGLACDFRQVTETVPASTIRDFAGAFKAKLHILNVDYHDKHFRSSTWDESTALHKMFEAEKPEYHYIENEDVEAGIDEFVRKHRLDLLITIPKKHNFLETIFKKRTTKRLVNEMPTPVLCIHS